MSRRLTFAAEVVDLGRVEYTVSGIGVFTLSYGASRYPHGEDGEYLEVAYGRWTSPRLPRRDQALEDAPVLYRVQLLGAAVVDVGDVLAHLADDQPSPWWLIAHRSVNRRGWAETECIPDGTRAKAAQIVAALAEDFLDRPDAADLLKAHRRAHAPHRLSQHRQQVQSCYAELEVWKRLLERESALVGWQQDLADGHDAPAPPTGPVVVHDEHRALTHLGMRLLAGTRR